MIATHVLLWRFGGNAFFSADTQASSPVSMVSSLLTSGANLEARADSPTSNLAAGAAKLVSPSTVEISHSEALYTLSVQDIGL